MDKEFDMELTRRFLKMYQRADKKGKGEILSQYCSLTDKSRDAAIKRFNRQLMLSPAARKTDTCKCRRGRPRLYNRVHDAIVKECWQLAIVRFYHGFATAVFIPVAMALVADLFHHERGEKMGWFSTSTLVGRFMAPIAGGGIIGAMVFNPGLIHR